MMSVYRELKHEENDLAELDAHLEQCAACREVLAGYTLMGDELRSAPVCAPRPEMRAKLMKALADEQLKVLQKSAPSSVPTPEFLKPYLRERAGESQHEDDIAAFSTADTGPLPFISTRRKRRALPQRLNQFGVLGLAAAALILLMLGGVASLLALEHNSPTSPSIAQTSNRINRPTEVDQKIYNTTTLYPNVTSALPAGDAVYYTASGNGVNSNSWMLMQFDRTTQTSQPLLDTPSGDPLIVLAVSHNWLVWLQYGRPQTFTSTRSVNTASHYDVQRSWCLHYLSLLPATPNKQNQPPSTFTGSGQSLVNDAGLANAPANYTLDKEVFDSATAPGWVNSPIVGSWLIGDTDTLLVTQIDQKGISHLKSYRLTLAKKTGQPQEIATAPAGHVLAWPTANSTGTEIYWADEWTAGDGTLRSNIWQQQISEQALRLRGQLQTITTSTKQLFQSDGLSFQPQIVDDTLFFLSTSEIKVEGQNVVVPNGIPFPVSATDASVQATPRTNTEVYAAPPDATIHGTLLQVPLDGPTVGTMSMLGTVGQSTGYQAGSTYVIWQDASGYQMYDLTRQSDVVLGNTLNNASLLVVNGGSTFWLAGHAADAKLQLMSFTWPS